MQINAVQDISVTSATGRVLLVDMDHGVVAYVLRSVQMKYVIMFMDVPKSTKPQCKR